MKCDLCNKDFKNLGGLNSHLPHCKKTISLKNDVIEMYKNENSIRDINRKLNLTKSKISEYLGDNVRNLSEANLLNRKKYPEKFKHSEKTKDIIRQKRLKFMRDNPDKTAWRLSNLSYPESLFLKKLIDLNWDKQFYINREKSIFPYFIDFAFENEKVGVEIDGSQHLEEDRKNKDFKKDELLKNEGWRVIRIPESKIKYNIDEVFLQLLEILNGIEKNDMHMVGIIKGKKKYVKKQKNDNGLTDEQIKGIKKQRKVERPPQDQLKCEINEMGYSGTGRKYGVSDNAIRKWVKYYEKYEK